MKKFLINFNHQEFGKSPIQKCNGERNNKHIRNIFKSQDFIPLHEPLFIGNEKIYLKECIDTSYVSSVGPFVDKFEGLMNKITNTKKTTAVVNYCSNSGRT